jgi:urease accessory protein
MNPDVLARIRAIGRALHVQRAGNWPVAAAIDHVVLDAEDRYRRRIVLVGEGGIKFLLDLPQVTALRHGDGLELEDGSMVAVTAKAEPLIEIAAANAAALARLAWHLGNRHIAIEFAGERLRMRRDSVIEAMVARLGGQLAPVEAPFEPERGAYAHYHGERSDLIV